VVVALEASANLWPTTSACQGVLEELHPSTRGTGALATKQHAREDAGRRTLGYVRNPRSLAPAKVPAVLVGALADAPRACTSCGFLLVTKDGPYLAATLGTFAGLGPAIICRAIDAVWQRQRTHSTYLAYSQALCGRWPYFPLPSKTAQVLEAFGLRTGTD
jgi:hypothetical protein